MTIIRRADRSERGYVLIMAALTLIPLLIVTGMAIDFGGGYWQGVQMQRATDAAALAGVIWLPDLTKATTVADDIMTKDGYAPSASNVVSVTQVADRQLTVKLTMPQNKYITAQLLHKSYTITRSSTSEYLRPIPMGSPINSLANDPESTATPPQIWLNQSGPGSTKGNGDRYSSGVCGASSSGYSSGCSGSTNTELTDGGYDYVTQVSSVGTGPLHFQAFDPAFVYTGDTCTSNAYSSAQQTTLINQYSSSSSLTGSADTHAAQRYNYSNTAYCPGDQMINGLDNLTTTYIVRAPDDTPLDLTDNPAICAISFSPYTGNYFNMLDQTQSGWNTPEGLENMPFWKVFRRWVDICTVNNPIVGQYVTQVTTTANQSAPHFSTTASLSLAAGGAGSLETRDNTIVTGGHNRYALRAGFGSGTSLDGTGVAEFAGGRLPIYVNQNTSSANFYLAQLQPQYAGSTLALNFFDIADTAGSATMQVLPPPDSNLSTFSNCTFTLDDPSGPEAISQSGCGITGLTSSTYDSRVVTLYLTLPSNYTCNSASSTGCWLTVQLSFSGAPADTTTWSAELLGDPVRLVQ
jgi:hypothetical protein